MSKNREQIGRCESQGCEDGAPAAQGEGRIYWTLEPKQEDQGPERGYSTTSVRAYTCQSQSQVRRDFKRYWLHKGGMNN